MGELMILSVCLSVLPLSSAPVWFYHVTTKIIIRGHSLLQVVFCLGKGLKWEKPPDENPQPVVSN